MQSNEVYSTKDKSITILHDLLIYLSNLSRETCEYSQVCKLDACCCSLLVRLGVYVSLLVRVGARISLLVFLEHGSHCWCGSVDGSQAYAVFHACWISSKCSTRPAAHCQSNRHVTPFKNTMEQKTVSKHVEKP